MALFYEFKLRFMFWFIYWQCYEYMKCDVILGCIIMAPSCILNWHCPQIPSNLYTWKDSVDTETGPQGPRALSQYKDSLSRFVDFHYKDKTVMRPCYPYNGNSYTGETTSLYYWNSPQGPLLLTWINFNPSMDKELHALLTVGWNYLSIPKLKQCNHRSLGMDKLFHPTLNWACNY